MWILDILSNVGKISPIQIAILMEIAKLKSEPSKVTELINNLAKAFEGFWEPKKGTIYPAIHNLHIRGFLKMHVIQPYGYSITPKGDDVIEKVMGNLEKQMQAYMQYYTFILEGYGELNHSRAEKIKANMIELMKEYLENQ